LREIQKAIEKNSKEIERKFATDLCTPNSKQDPTQIQLKKTHSYNQSYMNAMIC